VTDRGLRQVVKERTNKNAKARAAFATNGLVPDDVDTIAEEPRAAQKGKDGHQMDDGTDSARKSIDRF
jgi:hypothetical protein